MGVVRVSAEDLIEKYLRNGSRYVFKSGDDRWQFSVDKFVLTVSHTLEPKAPFEMVMQIYSEAFTFTEMLPQFLIVLLEAFFANKEK